MSWLPEYKYILYHASPIKRLTVFIFSCIYKVCIYNSGLSVTELRTSFVKMKTILPFPFSISLKIHQNNMLNYLVIRFRFNKFNKFSIEIKFIKYFFKMSLWTIQKVGVTIKSTMKKLIVRYITVKKCSITIIY